MDEIHDEFVFGVKPLTSSPRFSIAETQEWWWWIFPKGLRAYRWIQVEEPNTSYYVESGVFEPQLLYGGFLC